MERLDPQFVMFRRGLVDGGDWCLIGAGAGERSCAAHRTASRA